MKKIPTLFERDFFADHTARAKPIVTKGMEWVLNGEGIATIKVDGACCAIINGELYKRYDAKHGKPVPDGAIKCQEEADPNTAEEENTVGIAYYAKKSTEKLISLIAICIIL